MNGQDNETVLKPKPLIRTKCDTPKSSETSESLLSGKFIYSFIMWVFIICLQILWLILHFTLRFVFKSMYMNRNDLSPVKLKSKCGFLFYFKRYYNNSKFIL